MISDIVEEQFDDLLYECDVREEQYYFNESLKEKGLNNEKQYLLDRMLPIIKKKEYKYYCIYNYCSPVKAGGIGAVAGIGGGAGYMNMGHYTLYGSNEKPFSKSMLLKVPFGNNPWKKEIQAKKLKTSLTANITKKSDLPNELKKYVIE